MRKRIATFLICSPMLIGPVASVQAVTVTWTNGAATGIWNTTDLNWDNGGPTTYSDGDDVIFTTNNEGTFSIAADVAPGSVTFSGNNSDYTFTGGRLTAGTLTVNQFDANDRVRFDDYNSSFTHASTLVQQGELLFRPNVTGTYSFGTGAITLDGGGFGISGKVTGDFFLTNNIIVTSNGGRMLPQRGGSNPQHHYTGNLTLGGDLAIGDGDGGGPSNGDFFDYQGTVTITGGNRNIIFGNAGNGGITISGNITEDTAGRQLTLTTSTGGVPGGGDKDATIAGTNNTYSGGTLINAATSTKFIVAAGSSLGLGDVSILDDGNADVDLELLSNTNISPSAILSIAANGNILLSFTNDVVGVADASDLYVTGLILNGVSQAAGVYNATNASGFISGTGDIVVIPEPASLALMGLGGLLILGGRRRAV